MGDHLLLTFALGRSPQVHQEDALTKESMQTDPEARYWADRYTVQAEQVPMFLSSLEDDILTTGKYLNVLRGGTTRVESPVAITIPFAEGGFYRRVVMWSLCGG